MAHDTGDPFQPDLAAAFAALMPLTLLLTANFLRAHRTHLVRFLSTDRALVQILNEAKVALTEFEQPWPAGIVIGQSTLSTLASGCLVRN